MIMRGIDLSVGGMMMMTSVIISFLLSYIKLPVLALLVVGALIGLLLGFVNGKIIASLKVSSIIVTLATLSIYTGVSRFWFKLNPSASIKLVDYGTKDNIVNAKAQNLVIIMIGLVTIYILKYSKIGRHIYAIGGNAIIAKRKGINEAKTLIIAYTYSGFCAGVAAFMQMTLLGQTNAQAYTGLEFELIIIVIIGGLNIMGGYGTVVGTFFAASFMIVLRSGMVFARIPAFWHELLIGAIIICIVSYDMFKRKLSEQKISGQGVSIHDY
jgi:simple sugar transport system permease protein/ribose transport system permease protein